MKDKAFWTAKDVEKFLCVGRETLAQWRHRGYGPPFKKFETGAIRYVPSEVKEWIDLKKKEME